MAGAVSQYAGAAVAVGLFDRLGTLGVAWLRVTLAAALLWAWRRPSRRAVDRGARLVQLRFGVALAAMNLTFYLAIARLPLGTAVAIEFIGPISVAAFGAGRAGRRGLHLAAVALAATGVVLLADVQWEGNAAGVAFALAAAVMWAGYIVWGRRVGAGGATGGLDGLARSTAYGAAATAPFGLGALAGHGPLDGGFAVAVAACAVVALLSNVVPYGLDQVVLARLPAARFALLSTLLPVTALIVGVVVMGDRPVAAEIVGVGFVAVALALGGVAGRRNPARGVRSGGPAV